MFLFTSTILYVVVALKVVNALPLVKRIVIDPHITSPSADTVWTPGNTELVTWDTSIIPPTGNFYGKLLLGHQTANSENLDLDNPLANNFSLRDGSVTVTCPTVSPGTTYIVVLFGDSGNASPQFTISGPNERSGTPPSSPSIASPSSTQSSSAEPAAVSTTSSPLPSTTTNALTPTSSTTSHTTTPPGPSPAVSPSSSSSKSSEPSTSSSSSATSKSPVSGSSSNNAIPRTLNGSAIVACAVLAIATMFAF